jgi:hypothetical protein
MVRVGGGGEIVIESDIGIEVCLVLGLRLTPTPTPFPVRPLPREVLARGIPSVGADDIPFEDPETVEKEDTDRPRPRLFLPRPVAMEEETDDALELAPEPDEEDALERVPSRNRRLGGRSMSANVGRGADPDPEAEL